MEGIWNVYDGDTVIGKCKVEKKGLYWHFSCSCTLASAKITRLQIQIGSFRKNLGVLVPENENFTLTCQDAVRNYPPGAPEFSVADRPRLSGLFPIIPEEPFAYLERLQQAHLERKNGKLWIALE